MTNGLKAGELTQKEFLLKNVRGYLLSFSKEVKDDERIDLIMQAMRFVNRTYFVLRPDEAYIDTALSIGSGQTISQPSTVGRMLMLAKLDIGHTVLEVGAGSGWNAALIAFITRSSVISIDRFDELVQKAKSNTKRFLDSLEMDKKKYFENLDFANQNFYDFANDPSCHGRFDRILFTAGIGQSQEEDVQSAAKLLLSEKGRMVCPYTSGPMMVIDKNDSQIQKSYTKEQYVFVPLIRGKS